MVSSFAGLRRIGQIYMRAVDLKRATTFYRDTLSMTFLFEVPRMSFFDLAGVRLMLGEPEDASVDHPGSILYFDVPDLTDAHAELLRRGVKFDSTPHLIADLGNRELWMAFFKDSEGNQLALMSEIPKA